MLISIRSTAALVAALAAAGCAGAPAPVAQAQRPLVIEQYFAGRTVAEGAFRNTLSGSERKFTAIIDGRREGDTFILRERFIYADGERDVKTWRFRRTGEGLYSGTREDVIGQAVGRQTPEGLRLSYDVTLGADRTQMHFEDLLTLVDGGRVRNTAVVSKFGVKVGEVDLTMRKR